MFSISHPELVPIDQLVARSRHFLAANQIIQNNAAQPAVKQQRSNMHWLSTTEYHSA